MNLFDCNFKCIQQTETKQNIPPLSQIRIPNKTLEPTILSGRSLTLSTPFTESSLNHHPKAGAFKFLNLVFKVMEYIFKTEIIQVVKDLDRLSHRYFKTKCLSPLPPFESQF